ncbi:2154_t:CDS:2, partial [Paraglomus brasilianum]
MQHYHQGFGTSYCFEILQRGYYRQFERNQRQLAEGNVSEGEEGLQVASLQHMGTVGCLYDPGMVANLGTAGCSGLEVWGLQEWKKSYLKHIHEEQNDQCKAQFQSVATIVDTEIGKWCKEAVNDMESLSLKHSLEHSENKEEDGLPGK